VYRDKTKSRLEVHFGHVRALPQGLQGSYSVVHPNVLKGVGVLQNIIVNTIPLRVGQVINGTPLRAGLKKYLNPQILLALGFFALAQVFELINNS